MRKALLSMLTALLIALGIWVVVAPANVSLPWNTKKLLIDEILSTVHNWTAPQDQEAGVSLYTLSDGSGASLFLSSTTHYGIWLGSDGKAYVRDSTSTRVIP